MYVGDKSGGALKPSRFGVGAPVYRIIIAQLIASILAFVSCSYFDWVAAYSILSGGTVCVVPAAFSAWRLGKKTAGPGVAMIHMTIAETGKLLLTAGLFVMIFVLVKPLDLLFFFGTIIALHSLYILMPIINLRGMQTHIRD